MMVGHDMCSTMSEVCVGLSHERVYSQTILVYHPKFLLKMPSIDDNLQVEPIQTKLPRVEQRNLDNCAAIFEHQVPGDYFENSVIL